MVLRDMTAGRLAGKMDEGLMGTNDKSTVYMYAYTLLK